jgi:hypothetical protein
MGGCPPGSVKRALIWQRFFQLSFWIGEAEADPKSSNHRQSLPDFGFSAAGLASAISRASD